MAERYAIQSGNWSNTATWNGGTLPLSGDRVFANGFTLTINQSVEVISLHTDVGAIAVAGGRFRAISGGHIVNADSIAGSSICLDLQNGCIQNGKSTGGFTINAHGSILVSGGIQNGNSTGGSGSNANGSIVQTGGIQNGNSVGGSASGAQGSVVRLGGVIVTTGIVNSAFVSGLRLENDGTVILQGPDASLIEIAASPGRFRIGNQNHPFINPAGATSPPVVAAVARRSFIAGGLTA